MGRVTNIFRPTITVFLSGIVAGLFAAEVQAQSAEPLLQKVNLVYEGAFRLPQVPCGSTYACFNYGGTAIAYDDDDNALYIVGHPYGRLTAEVSIPAPVNSSTLADLNTASIIQPFADPTEGKRNLVNLQTPNGNNIGGQVVYDGNLIVSVDSYYDGSGTQNSSHFVRPLNLSTLGQVRGPYRVGAQYPGYVSGYMAPIPSEWQAAFGGPAITGNCCLAIASIQSNGPAISVFDPAQLGVTSVTPATPLLGYPISNPLGAWSGNNGLYNGTTEITGMVFPAGTRSVLFFGRQGTGPFCYGSGTSIQSLSNTISSTGVKECYDPANADKGTHGYPYVYQVWAYDANDLLAVKNGNKLPYQIRPYATWTFNVPLENIADKHLIGGAAYDAKNNLIYVSQMDEDGTNPIIDVFKITGASSIPSPPTDLRIH